MCALLCQAHDVVDSASNMQCCASQRKGNTLNDAASEQQHIYTGHFQELKHKGIA